MQNRILLPVIILPAVFLFSCKSHPSPSAHSIFSETTNSGIPVAVDDVFNQDSLTIGFMNQQTSSFIVSGNKVTEVTGNKGLKVIVDPSILETENGEPANGKISVQIIELSDTKDFFRANTATVCDGRLLASGGSYYIAMSAGEKMLRIKKGKALRVQFPVLRTGEMQLFYGERDKNEEMNWKAAGIPLKEIKNDDVLEFSDPVSQIVSYYPGFAFDTSGHAKIFRSLNDKVYLYDKFISILDLLDSVNKHEVHLIIDTLHMWPVLKESLKPGQYRDTGYLLANYGPDQQYIIRSLPEEVKRKTEIARQNLLKAAADSINAEAVKRYQSTQLTGQILKYYGPSKITSLGWINCDRFYREQELSNQELVLPITMRSSHIKYFLLFPSTNSLMTGVGTAGESGNLMLQDLPKGKDISFIGFVKLNGKIFQCRQDFTIGTGKPVEAKFKEISVEQLKQMFGSNVKA